MSTGGPRRLALHAVGDIGFGGSLRRAASPSHGEDPFAAAASSLRGADLLFANLETPLVPDGIRPALPEVREGFAGAPGHARRLSAAGFEIVSLANNHVMDYGPEGLRATLAALRGEGILAVGAGEDLRSARLPVVIERGGFRAGFLAYAAEGRHSASENRPGAAPLRESLILEDIRALARLCDAVIVSLHFGLVYSDYPRPEDQALARRICEGGASVILGHHPHVMQGVERRGDAVIAYSLGEFLFDPASGFVVNRSAAEIRREAAVFRVVLEGKRAASVELRATLAGRGLFPVTLEGDSARAVLSRLEEISAPLSGDLSLSGGVAGSTSRRTVSHQWEVFVHHLRRGHLGILGRWLIRLRPRHLALAIRALRSRAPGR